MLNPMKWLRKPINLVLIGVATTLCVISQVTDSQAVAPQNSSYEIWGSDQSNSVPGIDSLGIEGGWIWIWDSHDLEQQIESGVAAQPLGCDGQNRPGDGPCDVKAVFPPNLAEYDDNSPTGQTLGDLPGLGRLH
ncbi:MAG: hypothetical protein LAT50_16800, partial [Ectothiorhodospiraceae bacterium]|nr:hypothetical protein [Ectothiorhodospiraceae bacterium]